MAKYFNYFPRTLYSLEDKGTKLDSITNVIARFGFEDQLKENSAAYYKYQIKESDTPEIIASKFYDSSERHWIVLLFNNILDPQWDWPLNDRTFNQYVNSKYSTSEYADTANTSVSGLSWSRNINNEPKAYFKVITTTTLEKTTIEKLEVDSNTYSNNIIMQNGTNETYQLNDGTSVNIKITKEKQTYFDYEKELNESKREIKLLKKEFVSAVEKEFKKIIKQ
jgi:hypothetical protein